MNCLDFARVITVFRELLTLREDFYVNCKLIG